MRNASKCLLFSSTLARKSGSNDMRSNDWLGAMGLATVACSAGCMPNASASASATNE
jgi:hypothetical protein